jgi:tetratricopeptide (TPR) repeat protein
MNVFLQAASALLATALSLQAGAADTPAPPAPTASSAPLAAKCLAPTADRLANHACAVDLAKHADSEHAAGRNDAALAALVRADQFSPEDLRFAMAHAGLALKLANQVTPAGVDTAAKAAPGDVGLAMLHAELALSKKDFVGALADLDRALAQRPDAVLAWELRATTNVARPDFAAARGDVDKALHLAPKSAATLRMRAVLRNNSGDHAGALADNLAAHALAARAEDPFIIGATQFLQRQFGDAAASMARRAPPAPDGTYWRLWRYMSLARLDGIERASGSLGPGTPPGTGVPWPGPVVDFFHGSIDAATLLDAAQRSQAAHDLSQVCEAHFYMAEDALLRQHGDAIALFRQAAKECPINFHEYEGAVAELKAAGVPLTAPGPTLAAAAAAASAQPAHAASAASAR